MTVNLQSPTARAKLAPRGRPYLTRLQPGLHLGFRAGTGAWIAIGAIAGTGKQWQEGIGNAAQMPYAEAVEAAHKAARNHNGTAVDDPKTIDQALTEYEGDLISRGRNAYNARLPRFHLIDTLLAQPVAGVSANALRTWRDSLLTKDLEPASINRLLKPLIAALNRVADLDPDRAGANRGAWRTGLKLLPNATRAREAVLTDAQVRAVVAAAYQIDEAFGLYVEVHAAVGSRTSQLVRLSVRDFDGTRLMVPTSNKGRGERSADRTPVPVMPSLAKRLAAATAGRALDAPLLTWQGNHRSLYQKVVKAAGLPTDGDLSTIYALRHSSIARALLAGVPLPVVADWHDTSAAIIERHYAAFLKNHSEDQIRRGLIDLEPGSNVVPLRCG